jgi:hypothetical protein
MTIKCRYLGCDTYLHTQTARDHHEKTLHGQFYTESIEPICQQVSQRSNMSKIQMSIELQLKEILDFLSIDAIKSRTLEDAIALSRAS